MKIGVRAHDFGRKPADELAAEIKSAGFECVQLAPTKAIEGINNFGDITENHLEAIKRAFDGNRLEITVFGSYIEPSIQDDEARLKNVGIFNTNLTNARKLGVKIVGTETTNLNLSATEAEREAAYAKLKDSVLRMTEQAEKEDVFIGIEPVAEHTLNTPELTKRLLDEVGSDKLGIIFDPVNLVLPGSIQNQAEIFGKAFDLFGDKIVAVHIKDTAIENGEKTWRNIGEGLIDYALIFKRLASLNVNILREDAKMDSFKKDIQAMLELIKGGSKK